LNRKELREEHDAAEASLEVGGEAAAAKAKDEAAPGKTKDKGKPPVKRKSRAKAAKEVRLKAFWGVFNQTLRRVALFEYRQRAEADKKAGELSESQKTPHFVQLVKEVIEE
jgi:hypothetical protein